MADLDIPHEVLTTIIFVGLLIMVFRFSDLVAVIIIVASVAGLAFNWMSRQYDVREDAREKKRRTWEEEERWW
jgi:hypothetical protein